MRASACIAVFQGIACGFGCCPDGKRFQKERMGRRHAVYTRNHDKCSFPEIFFIMVFLQASRQIASLSDIETGQAVFVAITDKEIQTYLFCFWHGKKFVQQKTRNFKQAHGAGGDFGNAQTARIAFGQVDLDGLRMLAHARLLYRLDGWKIFAGAPRRTLWLSFTYRVAAIVYVNAIPSATVSGSETPARAGAADS